MNDFIFELFTYLERLILPATWVTIKLVFIVVFFGMIGAFAVGLSLYVFSKNGLKPNRYVYSLLNFLVNLIRSIPILILIIALIPVVRAIIGTGIGPRSVILPLILYCSANIGRLLENSFHSIDTQIIEAARSYGANNFNIIKNIVIVESIPSIIAATTIAFVNNLAASTIAGAVGGGGIGAIAITYGYQSFNNMVLYSSVVILFILVQIIQMIGNFIYSKALSN